MEEPKPEPTDEIVPLYANNSRFEPSAWDLRMFFGQLNPSSPGKDVTVDWHTDVTMPWAQAKLMHLYLGINIALYEMENGKIPIASGVMPQRMVAPPAGVQEGGQKAIETFEMVQKLVNDFIDRAGKEKG